MALIKLGGMIAEIRGSVGGTTFARNRGGAYARNRSVPLNPASVAQARVRQVFGDLAQRWSQTLTPAQRGAWETYADNVPLPNSLGELRNVTGLNMYQRSNALLIDIDQPRVDDAPTTFTVGPSFTPTYTVDAAADTADVTALGTFVPTVDGPINVLFSASPPQSVGVRFFKAPFRKMGSFRFTDQLVDLPQTFPLPFPVAAGQVVFLRSAPVTDDGRVGVPSIVRFPVA